MSNGTKCLVCNIYLVSSHWTVVQRHYQNHDSDELAKALFKLQTDVSIYLELATEDNFAYTEGKALLQHIKGDGSQ